MRYYVSKMIGTGQMDGDIEDPIRPKIADHTDNFSIFSAVGERWCLGLTTDDIKKSIVDDPDIIMFPDLPLDTLVYNIDKSTRDELFQKVQKLTGQTLTNLLPTANFKRVLEYLGQLAEPSLRVEKIEAKHG